MNAQMIHTMALPPKKTYKTPKVIRLGSIKGITLKTGSLADSFGTLPS